MTSGWRTSPARVMAAYVLIAHVEIRHLLTAVIMTSPATLMLAKILMPETETPATAADVKIEVEKPGVNIIDAPREARSRVAPGAEVGAMLIAFIGLIALVNGISRSRTRGSDGCRIHARASWGRIFAPDRMAAGREVERLRDGGKPAGYPADPE